MNLKNLVISVSNGLIRNERQASMVLVLLAVVLFLISIVMLFNTLNPGIDTEVPSEQLYGQGT
ncbi:hypothetical protein HY469_03565 [Candidatus Roizmanbacteria bacterium]|nr:hypothetical protein [Candidatus Roizmanbacteria bacterium]